MATSEADWSSLAYTSSLACVIKAAYLPLCSSISAFRAIVDSLWHVSSKVVSEADWVDTWPYNWVDVSLSSNLSELLSSAS